MTDTGHVYVSIGLAMATIIAAMGIMKARADVVVRNDPGGNLANYQNKVDAVRFSGERVIVDGICNSACTVWLTLPPNQICVTPRASFGFHSTKTSLGLPDPKSNDALINAYPPNVRLAVQKQGGLWLNTIRIRGTEIARRCKP